MSDTAVNQANWTMRNWAGPDPSNGLKIGFSFGLFEMARRSGYFPSERVDTFEPVIQEEARHILFFANWVAWYRRNLPSWRRPLFFVRTMAVWAFLAWERIGIARGLNDSGEMQDANFAVTGSEQLGIDINLRELFELCLTENERRMQGYDKRLLRPTTMPRLVRALLWFLPKKKPSVSIAQSTF